MITRSERLKVQKQMYLLAFGPLGLRHEDLWNITNGELSDMIAAYHYRLFCEKQAQAQHTVALLNAWIKNKISVQDFTGIWKDGRILTKEEFIEEWEAERKLRKEARLKDGKKIQRENVGFNRGRHDRN